MNETIQPLIGVDLGDRKSVACSYAQGRVLEWFEFKMDRESVTEAFKGKGYSKVAMEAGAQSGWVGRLISGPGVEVVVANPRKLRMISANERK